MVILLVIVINLIVTAVEALLLKWIGPSTGISYFDSATFGNLFFLVLLVNLVLGLSSASDID